MSDENHSLIFHSGSGLARVGSHGGRIMTEMVSGALALSRVAQTEAALVPRFRIGEHVFCEPDYQQILLWAKKLNLEPESVIQRLEMLSLPPTEKLLRGIFEEVTNIENGQFVDIGWDFGLLPSDSFEWVSGLVVKSLAFIVPTDVERSVRTVTIALPKLKRLLCPKIYLIKLDLSSVPQLANLCCYHNQLTELDLSSIPQLTELRCQGNQLRELDLSAVPLLTYLCCSNNKLSELDIRPLQHLEELRYDVDKTRLIQRPDQNF